jgi:hypothetical protein
MMVVASVFDGMGTMVVVVQCPACTRAGQSGFVFGELGSGVLAEVVSAGVMTVRLVVGSGA